MRIGAICDDYTGTASAGALVAGTGAKTGLFFDGEILKELDDLERLDAAYVSSNSRHLNAVEARKAVQDVMRVLKEDGVTYFAKKIDTTLRGRIGVEIDAMLDLLGEEYVAVMVSAMPASRRICVGGHCLIDGTILTETPVRHDVITPVLYSYEPDIIAKQSKYRNALVVLKDILEGPEAAAEKMKEARRAGCRIIICDAITMEHIDTIAQACVLFGWRVLPVDPGPFTKQLAFRLGLILDTQEEKLPDVQADHSKTVLLVCGSANPGTKRQMEVLRGINDKVATVSVNPELLIVGGNIANQEIIRASDLVIGMIRGEDKPDAILVETGLHGAILDLAWEDRKNDYVRGMSSWMINDGLAKVTENVLKAVGQEKIAGLLLTGGDTMERIARTIGVVSIECCGSIVPQIDVGRIIGRYDGLPVIVKGGFCGHEGIGQEIVDRIFLEDARREQGRYNL